MSNAITPESARTQAPREQDRVFNDETCRALRRDGREVGRLAAVIVTFAVGFVVTFAVDTLASSTIIGFGLTAAMSFVTSAATVAVMRWVNLVPTREMLREAWDEMNRDLRQQAREYAGDPMAIESRVLEDATDPNARPELAFGLPPEDCIIVFGLPTMGVLLAFSVSEAMTTLLFLGGSIALGGVLFAVAKRSDPNTYPPEDPP